jgi:hypothetical protein
MGGSWLGPSLQRDGAGIAGQQAMGARDQVLKRFAIAPQVLRFKPLGVINRQGYSSVIRRLKFVSHYGLGIDCPLQ